MKKVIKTHLQNIPKQTVKCLVDNRLPIYAKKDAKLKKVITIRWMSLKRAFIQSLVSWEIISSLCLLPELGISNIWANRAQIIDYNKHFKRRIFIFPLLLKANNEMQIQLDCIIIKHKKIYGQSFDNAIFLGLRYSPSAGRIINNSHLLLKYTIKHILNFLFSLSNRYPVVLLIDKKKCPDFLYWLDGNYSITNIPNAANKALRLVILNP